MYRTTNVSIYIHMYIHPHPLPHSDASLLYSHYMVTIQKGYSYLIHVGPLKHTYTYRPPMKTANDTYTNRASAMRMQVITFSV